MISKIADAGTRESMAFCIHFLKASSTLERHANNVFSLPVCSCLVKLASRPGEGQLLKCIMRS